MSAAAKPEARIHRPTAAGDRLRDTLLDVVGNARRGGAPGYVWDDLERVLRNGIKIVVAHRAQASGNPPPMLAEARPPPAEG